jgi:hypothetical protein
VRTLLFLLASIPVLAESHPTWWGLAPVSATAIVGIDWQDLRSSAFADAVSDELYSTIGLPALPAIASAKQILIASPSTLAMISGSFDPITLRAEAAKLGMKPATYQGVAMWISPDKSVLSVALLNDQMLLAGARSTLESAIDRSQSERRHYSPLLARAARYAESDLWVVADRLPDPLANIFVPIEAPHGAGGFEGYAIVRGGLTVEASLDAGTEDNAAAVAEDLRQSASSLPIAQGLEARVDGHNVFLSLAVDSGELSANLRATSAPQPAAPAPVPAPAPAPAPKPAPEPAGPQVIRIFGLDDGPREIVLPAAKPDKQQ